MTRHTYQVNPTMTGAVSPIMFASSLGELKMADYRQTIVDALSCGGNLDAPDFLPSGAVEENHGDIMVCTIDRPGRYTDAQIAKWQQEIDEMFGL